jgi:PAS domain S-box-containing protein
VASQLKNSPDNEGIMLIARDISVMKHSLEVIQRQSAYLQQLFDASPLAMAMVGVDGRTMDVNAAFEKIFGYSRLEVINNILGDFIIPDDKKNETREFWENAEKPKSVQFETYRKRRDGELIDVCISMYPIRISGKIHGVYSIYEDITPRKEYEKDLRYKNDELVKINTELDKFVYSISHDIRSPLMSTLGVLNMAEAESLNEAEYKMYLGLIRQNIDRLDTFTTASIKYYKNTRERIIPEMVDLREVLYECVETLRFQDEARDMDFFLDIDENTQLLSDRNKLQIIFSNLISNAIKYRRNGEEKSYLRISCNIKHDIAWLVFEDNGEGIPENKLGDIFTMFSRFSQRSSGSGLGLYIVKEVIDRLNGEISFASDFGKGTTISIQIPACEKEKVNDEAGLSAGQVQGV